MSIRAGASRKRLRKRWKVKESWRKSRVLGGKGEGRAFQMRNVPASREYVDEGRSGQGMEKARGRRSLRSTCLIRGKRGHIQSF